LNDQIVTIEQIKEEHILGYHQAVDMVAREKKYLARIQGPPLESAQAFAKENIQNGNAHIVAIANGIVVGWCDIVPMKKDTFSHCGVLGMGVVADFRGQGIGQKLIKAALQRAKENGLEKVELEVFHTNTNAISLYEKMGFVVEGRKRREAKLEGQYLDCIEMALFMNES